MNLGSGTASGRNAKGIYEDGKPIVDMRLAQGYMSTNGRVPGGDESFQKSTWADLSLEFFEGRTVGEKKAIYLGVYAGGPGSLGTRYTYEWKKVESNITTPAPVVTPTGNNAEAFASGARIMWHPATGLGYRLFRSTNQSDLGISVTDFYIILLYCKTSTCRSKTL